MVQIITMQNLSLIWLTVDFIKILEICILPIGLYKGWQKSANPMQSYGKIANFKDFYKINDMSDEAQILHGDYLDH